MAIWNRDNLRLFTILVHHSVGIEILPGDPKTWLPEGSDDKLFLYEERNLGIPHKVVYRAYLEAAHIFYNARKAWPPSTDKERGTLANSSSVLLLANPAHQTALNTRKRLILSGYLDPTVELGFTAALLSLHDGSKQSALWHHRRWLLRQSRKNCASNLGGDDDCLNGFGLSAHDYRSELSIASRACEVYPRNYFAWYHRHTCVRSLWFAIYRNRINSSQPNLVEILDEECRWIISWINRHISDYTAMQYACQLSQLLQDTSSDCDTEPTRLPHSNHSNPETLVNLNTFNFQTLRTHAQTLLRSYPEHESLWLYLRNTFHYPGTSIAERVEGGNIARGLILFVRDLLNTASKGSGQDKDTSLEDKYGTISLHAGRFLSWLARQVSPPPSLVYVAIEMHGLWYVDANVLLAA